MRFELRQFDVGLSRAAPIAPTVSIADTAPQAGTASFGVGSAPPHQVDLAVEQPQEASLAMNVIRAPARSASTSRAAIEQRIAEQPNDIRAVARALSQAVAELIELLKKSKPNDHARLAEYEDLVAFFEKMAAGLESLAKSLDQRIEAAASNSDRETVFLSKTAEIAEQLNLGLMEWLQRNRMKVFGYPFKIVTFGAAVAFLQHIGVSGDTVLNIIGGYILGKSSK